MTDGIWKLFDARLQAGTCVERFASAARRNRHQFADPPFKEDRIASLDLRNHVRLVTGTCERRITQAKREHVRSTISERKVSDAEYGPPLRSASIWASTNIPTTLLGLLLIPSRENEAGKLDLNPKALCRGLRNRDDIPKTRSSTRSMLPCRIERSQFPRVNVD